jgi:uncharacterized protein
LEFAASLLPQALSPLAAFGLVIASFFTSALTAAFGLGGGVAMLALMGLAMPVAALIPVHGMVQLGSNAGRAWLQRENISTTIAWPFLVGSLAGAVIGAYTVLSLPDALMKTIIGIFIIITAWMKFPVFARLKGAGIAIGSGIIAILSMLVGASGPLLTAFFGELFPDDRKEMVATAAAGMTIHHGLKVIVFAIAGFAFTDWLPLMAAMIAAGYWGTIYGTKLLHNIPEVRFRLVFKWVLTLLALNMLRTAWF